MSYQSNIHRLCNDIYFDENINASIHWAFAACEKTGEVAKEVKNHEVLGTQSYDKTREILKEKIGDTLMYLINLASEYDLKVEEILTHNQEKVLEQWDNCPASELDLNPSNDPYALDYDY